MTANRHDSDLRAERYAQHVADLASAFNVKVTINAHMPPEMSGAGVVRGTSQKCIVIAPVTDDATYAIALHELGHCIAPNGMLHLEMSRTMQRTNAYATLRDIRLQLEEETAAWAWARYYALSWTAAMIQVEKFAFDTYRAGAKRFGVQS